MNVDLGIWDKLARMIVFLLLLAALLGIAIWYFPLIQRNERMRKEIHALDADIKKAEEDNKRLTSSIEATRDQRPIERLARDEVSYARSGETIIRFGAPSTNRVSSKATANSN